MDERKEGKEETGIIKLQVTYKRHTEAEEAEEVLQTAAGHSPTVFPPSGSQP